MRMEIADSDRGPTVRRDAAAVGHLRGKAHTVGMEGTYASPANVYVCKQLLHAMLEGNSARTSPGSDALIEVLLLPTSLAECCDALTSCSAMRADFKDRREAMVGYM